MAPGYIVWTPILWPPQENLETWSALGAILGLLRVSK